MSWRLGITHRTGYRYGGPVSSSYNEARLTPRTEEGQLVLDHRIDIVPTAQVATYTDYWGTQVTSFDLHVPHDSLEVTAHCVLESTATGEDPAEGGAAGPGSGGGGSAVGGDAAALRGPGAADGEDRLTWSDLADEAVRDRWVELLLPTRFTAADEQIRQVGAELRALRDPRAAAEAAIAWVREQLSYVPGATGVHTRATDALSEGRGVCQDFAHLTLALLRTMGIPARYVSGYMHPGRDVPVGVAVAGESHAWVEWWAGRFHAYDPTNGRTPDAAYASVARGRDYLDVAPLRGVYTGAATSQLQVSVEITRLA